MTYVINENKARSKRPMLLTRIRPALRDLYVINENKPRSKRPMLLTRIRPALRDLCY